MLVNHFCDYNNIGGTEIAIQRYVDAVSRFGVKNNIFLGVVNSSTSFLKVYTAGITHNHMCFSILPHFYILSHAKKIPSIITLHSMFSVFGELFPFLSHKHLLKMEKYTCSISTLFDAVTVPSKTVKEYWEDRNVRNIKVIHYPINTSVFKPLNVKKNERFSLLHVGQFRKDKRVPLILKAARGLDVDLHLYGGLGVDYAYVEMYAKKHRNIKLHGFVQNTELPRIYSGNHVYVNASISETFGLSMAEAMACGLPVVSLDNLGARELVKKGTGFIVDNEKEMREMILYLKDNPSLRARMGRTAIKRMESFSPEIIGKKLFKLYESIY